MIVPRFLGGLLLSAFILSAIASMGETGEVGVVTVSQANGSQWHSVTTNHSYNHPVVIMGPPSYRDSSPVTVRVLNVNANGFQFQLDGWDYLSGTHGEETLSYLVMEAGSYTFANGTRVEAGILKQVDTGSFKQQNFESTFSEPPALFAQVVSRFDSNAVTHQVSGITTTRFSTRLLVEEEKRGGGHGAENVAWLAIEPSRLEGVR